MSYFEPPFNLRLNQLEEIVYSTDRKSTINRLFASNSEQAMFYNALISQLEVETAFEDALPQKIREAEKYIESYKRYCTDVLRRPQSPPLALITSKQRLYEFQCILQSLGATDDDIKRLELFHNDSVTNYAVLNKHITSITNVEDKIKAIENIVEIAYYYFDHAKPNATYGSSQLAHWTSQMTGALLDTTLDGKFSNPLQLIHEQITPPYNPMKSQQHEDFRHLSESAVPYIFLLHKTGRINLLDMDYFATIHHLLLHIRTTTSYPSLVEILAWYLKESKRILDGDTKVDSIRKFRPYAAKFHNITLSKILTYQQLIQLQQLYPDIGQEASFIEQLIERFVPPSFEDIRLNRTTGVSDALKLVGESGTIDNKKYYGLLHQPIHIHSQSDITTRYQSVIPSFVITAMDIYDKCLQIISENLEKNKHLSPLARKEIEELYYSFLSSYLYYTASYNVYRYDLFDHKFITALLLFPNHSKYDELTRGKHDERAVSYKLRLSTRILPQVSFDRVVEIYLTQYFTLPSTTNISKYSPYVRESFLYSVFYATKTKHSGNVINVKCVHTNTPTVHIASEDETISPSLNNITVPNASSSSSSPSSANTHEIDSFNIYGIDNVKQLVDGYLHDKDNHNNTTRQSIANSYTHKEPSPSIEWAPRVKDASSHNGYPLLNKQCIDKDGNIRASLITKNIDTVTVNVYDIDIFSYYKSQLTQPNNQLLSDSNSEFDPNIDLEGLVPNYTTKVDLTNHTNNLAITSESILHLNLTNLPRRGIFLIEVINGQQALRCCCRKGSLSCITQQTQFGTMLILLDEDGKVVKDPRVYIGTEMFAPSDDDDGDGDASGRGTAPTSTTQQLMNDNDEIAADVQQLSEEYNVSPSDIIIVPQYEQQKVMILTDKSLQFAATHKLSGFTENYSMQCQWFTSSEALTNNCDISSPTTVVDVNGEKIPLKGGNTAIIGGGAVGAEVIIRPTIYMQGKAISPSSVTVARSTLRITATLQNGVSITDTVDHFPIYQSNNTSVKRKNVHGGEEEDIPALESIHAFSVPPNLASLSYTLDVTIANSLGKEFELSSSETVNIGGIHKTNLSTGMVFLRRVNGIYMVYTVDKTGKSLPFIPLDIQLTNYSVNYHQPISLSTDVNGCAELGPLLDTSHVAITVGHDTASTGRSLLSPGTLTYCLNETQSQWPPFMRILVDDNYDKTEASPQVILPLPFAITQDKFLVKLALAQLQGDNSSGNPLTLRHTTRQPLFTPEQSLTSDELQKVFEYLITTGRISLYEVSSSSDLQNVFTSNCIDKVSIAGRSIMVSGLAANKQYRLICMNGNVETSINIQTYRHPQRKTVKASPFGVKLPSLLSADQTIALVTDYLVCAGGIFKINSLPTQLSIASTQYNASTQTLTVDLTNWSKTTQIAVYASTFITSVNPFLQLFTQRYHLLSLLARNDLPPLSHATPSSTSFVSAAAISGEREYILHRRALLNEIDQVGVMLPTPTLLLNKRLVRHTTPVQDREKNKAQKGAVDECASESVARCYDQSARNAHVAPQRAFCGSRSGPSVSYNEAFYTMDILREKSCVLMNIVPNQETGTVTIQHPGFKFYSNITIVAYDSHVDGDHGADNSLDMTTIDIPQSIDRLPYQDRETVNEATKHDPGFVPKLLQPQQQPFVCDNSFKSTLDPSKQYAEEHQVDLVLSGDHTKTIVGPHKSIELDVITSTKDLHALLTSLNMTHRQRTLLNRSKYGSYADMSQNHIITNGLSKFRFINEWSTYPDSTKLTLLDRHACHELHLFIMFQDRPFFEKYLRLHLSNKLQKSIVDLWLLSQPIHRDMVTTLDGELVDLFNAIRQESIEHLHHHSRNMDKFNIVEKILVLSIADKKALRSSALYMRGDRSNNASNQRDSEAWVYIFESCLRRRLLVLNAQQSDDDAVDQDDEDAPGDDRENIDDKQDHEEEADSDESMSDYGDDDHDDDGEMEMDKQEFAAFSLCDTSLESAMPMTFGMGHPPPPPSGAPRARMMMAKSSARAMAPAPMMALSAAAPSAMMKRSSAVPATTSTFSSTMKKMAQTKPKVVASYKPLEKTGEYEERTWYLDASYDGKNYALETQSLMTWSNFWVDFALHLSQDYEHDDIASGKLFASRWVMDIYGGSVNEYLLALAFCQLSPVPVGRGSVMGIVRGKDIVNSTNIRHVNHSTSIQPDLTYRTVQSPKYPVIVLHKQLQMLVSDPQQQQQQQQQHDNMHDGDNDISPSSSTATTGPALSIAQYYIDVLASYESEKYVYVQPTSLIQGRVYMCRVVTSNMTSSSIKSKILVQIPDNTVSVYLDQSSMRWESSRSSNTTHFGYLDSTSVYISVNAYSSYIVSYAFLVGYQPRYLHYGPTVSSSSSKSGSSQLYCFAPSSDLLCHEDKPTKNKNDPITIAREADDETLCRYLEDHFKSNDGNNQVFTVNSDDDNTTQPFSLPLIFFRFVTNGVTDVNQYSRQLNLYIRIVTIAKGYISHNSRDSDVLALLSYALNFIRNYYKVFVGKFTFTPQQLHILSYALSVVLKSIVFENSVTFKSYNHLEYLPLVAARIHNSSMAMEANKRSGYDDNNVDNLIPDVQLKEQYTRAMMYAITRSTSVETIDFTHTLSLLYYSILLNRKAQVKSLLGNLLNSLSRTQKQKQQQMEENNGIGITTRVQLAYMLCYIDVSTYGQLLSSLSREQIAAIESLYRVDFNQVTSQYQSYQVSVVLSTSYKSYPIRQWRILFSQTYNYLVEGEVISTSSSLQGITSPLSSPTTGGDKCDNDNTIDVNVAGASAIDRDTRQNTASNTTPSLSCRVQYGANESIIDIYYTNLQDKALLLDIHFIDSELLLSHKPFMSITTTTDGSSNNDNNNNQRTQITRPHLSISVPITSNTTSMTHAQYKIPAKFSTNAQLTIRAPLSHVQSVSPLLHNNFVTQVLSKQGIVRIVDSNGKPIPGVYVKCYAQEGSKDSRFHHDGYTDIRGKFDYASTSQKNVDNASGNRFALIIAHPTYGTTVAYTDKPQE